MRFLVLGPLAVIDGEHSLALGGPKQRALLAILLLHANEAVSRDRLIEGIWGTHPPAHPGRALDTYVSRLRTLLGKDRIRRRGGGYALWVGPDELDLEQFGRAAAGGRYAEALALWRGPALADLLFEPFAQDHAEQLEERRLHALEQRIEAELGEGHGADLVAELEQLVREDPLRERFVGQLMLALYRAGQQSAALETYRRTRRSLASELGLEPGPQLQELERRILVHDPALGRISGGDQPRLRRRPVALAAGVVIVAAGVVAGVVFDTRGPGGLNVAAPSVSRLLAIGPSGRIAHATELPSGPAAMTAAGGSLWLADPADEVVLRADPRSGAVVDRIPVAGQPGSITTGGGGVWVASTLGGTVERIDPAGGAISQAISLGQEHTSAIAYGHGALWVADTTDDAVIELDAITGTSRRTLSLDARPTSVVVGDRALWVADQSAATVSEVDLGSGQTVSTIHVGNGPSALALGAGGLWVANGLDSTVTRIDPRTSTVVATIPVGSGPSAVVVADGTVWVANQFSGTVTRIDPSRNAAAATIRFEGQPVAIAAAGGTVWVGDRASVAARRGGTLVLASSSGTTSVDPGIYSQAANPQFTGLAYDSLVTFSKTSGPDGLHVVPDLALQVPTPTAGGTVYTFRLRRGIRYSDGRTLRAADFRRSLERLFRIQSPGADDYGALVGADVCRRAPTTCDLSRAVITDDRAGTVVFHLSRADPDFLFKLADFGFSAPLPPGVPEHDAGYQALPGTGPYRIARAGRREIEFTRNPYFHEWSHAAQPSGNPDRILWRFSDSHAQTIRWVESGRADWTWDLISPADLHAIRIRAPSLLHSNPIFAVEFLHLNTHAPPFDDVRVRQALNFAIDRDEIAQMYGGPFVAAPTCQPLVPGFMGYKRYCPYTRRPAANGAYHGPDLARARRLVAASGTRGERVDVWGANDEPVVPRQETVYVGNVLRSLGYRVRVHLARFDSITQAMRRRHQISTDGDWLPNYPAPSSYLPTFFACGGNHGNGYVCNRQLDTEMSRALSDQLDDPRRGAAEWMRVDHLITDKAYWVPTVTDRFIDLVSKRVRNYQFSPVWGFIADQAWVR